jgi:hypothetical protein
VLRYSQLKLILSKCVLSVCYLYQTMAGPYPSSKNWTVRSNGHSDNFRPFKNQKSLVFVWRRKILSGIKFGMRCYTSLCTALYSIKKLCLLSRVCNLLLSHCFVWTSSDHATFALDIIHLKNSSVLFLTKMTEKWINMKSSNQQLHNLFTGQ